MKNSKTPEMEKRDLAALNPEDVEEVSGGYVYYNRNKPDYNWEAISNRDGSVIDRFDSHKEAVNSIIENNKKENSDKNTTSRIWFSSTLDNIRKDNNRDKIKLN